MADDLETAPTHSGNGTRDLFDLADEVNDVTAAALGKTGLAALLGLTWRAKLQPGQNVLVLGATGALESVAVQLAKSLGVATVVAADRDPAMWPSPGNAAPMSP